MAEVSEITRAPIETLRYWRAQGTGPECFKLGRRIVYPEAAVTAWIDELRAKRPA